MPAATKLLPDLPPLFPGWRLHDGDRLVYEESVTINSSRIPELLPWLAPGPRNDAWRTYVGPVVDINPDLPRLFYEMALTIAQFGGFVAHRGDGHYTTWKRDGSGVKAIVATMAAIREAKKLPQIDVREHLDKELAHFFIRTTFGKERLDMLIEVGRAGAQKYFSNLLKLARRRDGSYCFDVVHMRGLACRFPLAFGSDPIFYKKASLLLMTMEIALNALGHKATAQTLPPADYRIPQILEGLGILRLSNALRGRLVAGHVFRIDDAHVRAMRAMTVEAVGMIKRAYEHQYNTSISCAELDGLLYLLSRNRPLMSKASMKPHMLVATHAF